MIAQTDPLTILRPRGTALPGIADADPIQNLALDGHAAPFVAQPVLVVGGGGIGHRVVLDLKAQLIRTFGAVPEGIRLLVFDIDQECLTREAGGHAVALEPDSEVFALGPVPVARICRNLENMPTIAERLKVLRSLSYIGMAHAAKALRPIGNLGFQWKFPDTQAVVGRAVRQLAGRDNRGHGELLVDPGRGIKVIQVGSLCGGTNSGMFIDLAVLIRSELEALGGLGDACTVMGVGMLPGAFHGTSSPNLVPNTVAALLELERVQLEGPETFHYRNGVQLRPTRPPFDMYLLVDAVDEAGLVWSSRDELCAMVARAIYVLAATHVGEQGDVQRDNLDEVLSGRTPGGHGTFFGSIGLAVLELPTEGLARLFAARHGEAVIRQTLLPAAPPALVADEALAWWQALGVGGGGLAAELGRDADGVPLAVDITLVEALRQAPDAELPRRALDYVQTWRRVRIETEARAAIERHGLAATERLRTAFEERLTAAAADPRLGVTGAAACGAALREHLATERAGLAAHLDGARQAQERATAAAEAQARSLRDAANSAWPFRHGRVQAALDGYFRAAAAECEALLQSLVAERTLAVAAAALADLDAARRGLAGLAAQLAADAEALAEAARVEAAALAPRRGDPALVLVGADYREALYARHAPSPASTTARLARGLGPGGLLAAARAEPGAVASALADLSLAAFEAVRGMSIEQAIAEQPGYSPRARLAALEAEAAPALNLDLTCLQGGDAALRRVNVVGVPDSRSLFRGEADHVVSTRDPRTIMALSLTLGVPYPAIQGWSELRAAYDQALRLRPLHTLPAFQSGQQEHRLAFGLGLAFELVRARGAWFYYQPADTLARELALGQGGENALRQLARQDAVVRDILDRVEARIEAVGTVQALAALDAWCRPGSRDDDLERDLKSLVRDYADVLRGSARLAGGGR